MDMYVLLPRAIGLKKQSAGKRVRLVLEQLHHYFMPKNIKTYSTYNQPIKPIKKQPCGFCRVLNMACRLYCSGI
jgi:hypothetical protein